MIVRRLTQWTKQFCSRVAARLRLRTAAEPEREPVLSGSVHARLGAAPGVTPGTITATHWLDDARRMRPRRVRSIPLPQPTSDEKPQEKPLRSHLDPNVLRSPSHVKPPNSLPLSPDRVVRSTSPQAQPHRPETTHDVLPPDEQPETDAHGIDDKLRRRLRSLQFLVRHGVYNEGFARNSLPEQYRRSAGLADDEDLPF